MIVSPSVAASSTTSPVELAAASFGVSVAVGRIRFRLWAHRAVLAAVPCPRGLAATAVCVTDSAVRVLLLGERDADGPSTEQSDGQGHHQLH